MPDLSHHIRSPTVPVSEMLLLLYSRVPTPLAGLMRFFLTLNKPAKRYSAPPSFAALSSLPSLSELEVVQKC